MAWFATTSRKGLSSPTVYPFQQLLQEGIDILHLSRGQIQDQDPILGRLKKPPVVALGILQGPLQLRLHEVDERLPKDGASIALIRRRLRSRGLHGMRLRYVA